jgi:hypothetical protein
LLDEEEKVGVGIETLEDPTQGKGNRGKIETRRNEARSRWRNRESTDKAGEINGRIAAAPQNRMEV